MKAMLESIVNENKTDYYSSSFKYFAVNYRYYIMVATSVGYRLCFGSLIKDVHFSEDMVEFYYSGLMLLFKWI